MRVKTAKSFLLYEIRPHYATIVVVLRYFDIEEVGMSQQVILYDAHGACFEALNYFKAESLCFKNMFYVIV